MALDVTADAATGIGHPLDPLTADELLASRSILHREGLLGEHVRFALVQLVEPHKRDVLARQAGDPIERRVFSLLLDVATGDVWEAVVSVTTGAVVSRTQVATKDSPYGQPGLVAGDLDTVAEVVKGDARWQAAMAERGIADHDHCVILPLTPGQFDFEDELGRRVLRAVTLYQEEPTDIPWLRPVEGVIVYVDLIERSVVRFYDHGAAPLPPRQPNFGEGDWGPVRTSLRPLAITQPQGPSFQVDGNRVTWERWSLRIGFDAREGLVLHQVGFADAGRTRPVLYRASISEMVVPYADPHPMRFWISYFDEGEYGLGRLASSLTLGCDCLGEIRYFDAVLADSMGQPYVLPNVVCVHEEDVGVMWKHDDHFSATSETRRARRLVISFWTAIGNYDYGFFWYLYQDGTIELDVKLTGIVFAVATDDTGSSDHATPVAPGIAAPFHQHLFNARLDMTVDGVANRVEEVDVVALETGDANPYGNAFTTRTTLITSESDAARLADAGHSRTWRIVNDGSRNHVGQPVAYQLTSKGSPVLLAQPGSSVAKRAGFATRHVWVTRYEPGERYAAGDYPNQHGGGSGLPAFQSADRPLVDEDVVVWHTFGSTHIPRSEDWPVMPVEHAGFSLRPSNFFDRNPTLDLPRSSPGSECSVDTGGTVDPPTCH
ncbi:MAG: primary-amine oxidase [Ilumatobacteraceae bacterium]